MSKYLGSCLCGQVKFEIETNIEGFYLCHCKYCQKDSGSAHTANMFSKEAKLTWLSGEDRVKTFNLSPTRHTKSFCSECSSALPSWQLNGSMFVMPAGSFDTPISIRPSGHIFCSSRASWDKDLEHIQQFEKLPW